MFFLVSVTKTITYHIFDNKNQFSMFNNATIVASW